VADSVQRGDSLSIALARHPGAFDEVLTSLVHTGEVSGTLDRILEQTATYLERAETLRLRVKAALRYPIFVFVILLVVLTLMLVWIVPMFTEIYARFRVPLPWPTKLLVAASAGVLHNLPLVLAVGLGLVAAASYAANTPAGRLSLDSLRLRMPLFGRLARMYAISKFARGLSILTASGTQILASLRVIRPVPGNRVIERGIDQVRAQVEEGSSLARALGNAAVFPEMLVQMTATGEETGKLDTMLSRTADFYEQRVTAAVDGLSSLIEPITIIVLGGMVGLMLMALYLPIFSLGQAMRSGLGTP
jgi:type IV pilus assembly protein PilC